MPASKLTRPRERFTALAGVVLVQAILAFTLIRGLRVEISSGSELISHLIEITLPKPPPPVPKAVVHVVTRKPSRPQREAPRALPKPIGGSPGPKPSASVPAPTPVVSINPSQSSSGGGSSTDASTGSGQGGGTGGQGNGDGNGDGNGGGTDLVQIAGEILSSDYPKDLREHGIGGRVAILFTVGPDGRVKSCTVTRSSGVAELDQLTCQLITQRFRYRPSTDRFGRPIADEVEGEHDWVAGGG